VRHSIPKLSRVLPLLRVVLASAIFASLIATKSVAQHRALIVSLDSYADAGLGGLPSGLARNNAAAIKKLLTEKLGYKHENIKVLQNKQATKSAIKIAIESWLGPVVKDAVSLSKLKGLEESGALKKKSKGKKKRAKKQRRKRLKSFRSYLYFAGYGIHQPEEGVAGLDQILVPYDAKIVSAGEKKIISNIISDVDLENAIAKFVRRHTTIVFDTKLLENSSHGQTNKTAAKPVAAMPSLRPLTGAVGSKKKSATVEKKKSGPKTSPKLRVERVTIWSAASPSQTVLFAGSENKPVGPFTSDYVKAIVEAEADANANDIISNAEVLHYVSDKSSAHCQANNERCALGKKPRLRPAGAYGRTAWIDRKKVSLSKERRLTLTRLADFLGVPNKGDLSIKQDPPSPIKVGTDNIHYEVRSASSGHLVLLNLTERGELFQLYPNQYAGQDDNGFAGKLEANMALKVPEDSYGISFSATVPAKGHIIAVMAPGLVKFDESVNARTISSVSQREAIRVYLAELTAALNASAGSDSLPASSQMLRWSIMTLPYEILP